MRQCVMPLLLQSVAAVHKATIHKLGDGLFLECCREAAKPYPGIAYEVRRRCLAHVALRRVSLPAAAYIMPNLPASPTRPSPAGGRH